MKSRILISLVSVLMTVLLLLSEYYTVIIIDTNSVMDEAKDIFFGKYSVEETKESALGVYNSNSHTYDHISLYIQRSFVIHDRTDGYMYIKYTVTGFDENDKTTFGSSNVDAVWTIHKVDGEWQVTNVHEHP